MAFRPGRHWNRTDKPTPEPAAPKTQIPVVSGKNAPQVTVHDVLSVDSRKQEPAPQETEDWHKVDSENISQILYSAPDQILIVEFQNGGRRYAYADISQRLFEGLKEADSPTAYLKRYIIPTHRVARLNSDKE